MKECDRAEGATFVAAKRRKCLDKYGETLAVGRRSCGQRVVAEASTSVSSRNIDILLAAAGEDVSDGSDETVPYCPPNSPAEFKW